MPREIDPASVLRAFVAKHPTKREAAQALGISQPYLGDLLNGNRGFSASILKKLGLKRIVVPVRTSQ